MITARIGSSVYRLEDELELYFQTYRNNVIGIGQTFLSPYGEKKVVYADWTASGRLYRPIEEKICDIFGSFLANTHTESNITGSLTTYAYEKARDIVKNHVNADEHDVILFDGFGMTAAVNKLQRILGLRVPEKWRGSICLKTEDCPVIFITHMEHHSNHTSWLETIGEVIIIPPGADGLPDQRELRKLLEAYKERKYKIGSFTACSNVTGIQPPYHRLARIMHEYGGLCFVDFAASAPYVKIDMHPDDPMEKLDAIFFSMHKFLGGPGSSGILIFDSRLYSNHVPDHPGGGTVLWTNPWGEHKYYSDIETREDGGTPGILQAIRAALCISLKEQMGIENILEREHQLVEMAMEGLKTIPGLRILEEQAKGRLGIISFYVEDIHYNLIVKLLNDLYGYQVRGGCSCAGTYGHYFYKIDKAASKKITDKINQGDLSAKPGWVRFSIHPVMTNREVTAFVEAIRVIVKHIDTLKKDYVYNPKNNDYFYCKHARDDMDRHFRL